jgi:hypothetical protein
MSTLQMTRRTTAAGLASLLAVAAFGATQLPTEPRQVTTASTPVAVAEPLAQDEGDVSEFVLEVDASAVFLSRDPFAPVVTSLFEATDGGAGGGTDGGADGGTGGGTDGGTGGGTDGGTDGGSGGGTDGGTEDLCQVADSEAACVGIVIGLSGFDDEGRALVTVGGSTVVAEAGDILAGGTLLVVSLEPPCATFLFGDEGFTLCAGEQVLK